MHTFTSLNWNSDDENAIRVQQEREKAAKKLQKAQEKAKKEKIEQQKRKFGRLTPKPSPKLSTRLTKAKPSDDPTNLHQIRFVHNDKKYW